MINIFLSALLVLMPLKPANIPPNWIYLGEKVEPIKGIKAERGFVLSFEGAVLTVPDFIRIKSIIEGSKDICVYAVDSALKECNDGMTKALSEAHGRETNHFEIITAYESRLGKYELQIDNLEESLQTEKKKSKMLLFIASGLGVVATLFTTLYFAKD